MQRKEKKKEEWMCTREREREIGVVLNKSEAQKNIVTVKSRQKCISID